MAHFSKIYFIGGIHGVGKSTVCIKVCEEQNIGYLSASQLIEHYKRKPVEADLDKDKYVKNINSNQNILINALNENVISDKSYILDGHFSLLDLHGKVQVIPVTVFKEIMPKVIITLIDEPASILKKLNKRNQIEYNLNLLSYMQERELCQARLVGNELSIEVHEVSSDDIKTFGKIISDLK